MNIEIDYTTYNGTCDDIYKLFKHNGILVIKNYFDRNFVEKIICDFSELFDSEMPYLYHEAESLNKDKRIWNVESKNILDFSTDKLLCDISTLYYKDHPESFYAKNIERHYTMANKLEYIDGENRNSGGTWHRDNPKGIMKNIMYLSNCSPQNGCLQFLSNSSCDHIGYPESSHKIKKRYFDNDIQNILINFPEVKLYDIAGNIGDVILLDASYIHRGKPIENGIRYAITNYPYKHK
jgi:hypothetical protein